MDCDNISFNDFAFALPSVGKTQVLQNISWLIGKQTDADMTWIAEQFLHNENHENSTVGNGVAIPQIKSAPLKKPFLFLAKLQQPVDFTADDGQDVDLICAVLSPVGDGPLHLRRLSRVTRLLKDKDLLAQLRAAQSRDEMAALFSRQKPLSIAA